MAMAGVLHLWNEWEIQILVLVSFALQVFLLSFAWMRRRSISRVLRIPLWLMYLLAEFTTTYTLGHMSIGCKAGEHQQLMAFWAPFLLVHLGGQDTITAYAMEDSQLWLRHLLTFAVQALGAGYVLYKYMGSRGPLVAPAVLMFTVGVLKNAERVWSLSFSRLEIIRRYLDGVSIKENAGIILLQAHSRDWMMNRFCRVLMTCSTSAWVSLWMTRSVQPSFRIMP
jgi:hypothetical protein